MGEQPGGTTMNMVGQAKSRCAEQKGIYAKGGRATRYSLRHTTRVTSSVPRNSDGNPDSPQVVVFLATVIDVTVDY